MFMCSFTKHLTFKWPLERALWTLSLYAEVHSEAKGKVLKHHLATPPPSTCLAIMIVDMIFCSSCPFTLGD